MRIKDLNEKLMHEFVIFNSLINENFNIIRTRLLIEGQKRFEINTLYIGTVDLAQSVGAVPSDTNLVLVTDQKDSTRQVDIQSALSPFPCNLILLQSDLGIHEIFNKIQDIYQDSSRLLDGSASLLECIIRGKEIREIIETGYDILNNPIMLMDTSYKVLSYKTDARVNDEVWDDLVSRGYSSYKYVTKFKYERIIEKILVSDEPILLDTGVAEKIRRILGKIQVGDKCMGYLAILEYRQPFQNQDLRIAKLICEVISSIMKEEKWQKSATGLMWENLIQDLLEEKVTEEEDLNDRLQSCEWKPNKNMCMVSIDMSRFNDPSFIDYFRQQIHKLTPLCRSIYYHDAVSVLLEFQGESGRKKLLSSMISFLKEIGLHAGCSESFTNLSEIGRYYRQSRKALLLGEKLDPKKRMSEYQDYILSDFLYDSSTLLKLDDFCHPGVLKLDHIDQSSGTEYFRTLFEYLKNNKNVIATAEALYIHRNTVNYRLDKIKELLESDLKEAEESMHILLTYKMIEIMKL